MGNIFNNWLVRYKVFSPAMAAILSSGVPSGTAIMDSPFSLLDSFSVWGSICRSSPPFEYIGTQILHDFTGVVVKYQNHDHPMALLFGMRPIGLQICSFPVHPVPEWFFLADSELGVQSDSILLGMALFGSTVGKSMPCDIQPPKVGLVLLFLNNPLRADWDTLTKFAVTWTLSPQE